MNKITNISINLYLQNYFFLDKINYVSQMSMIFIEPQTNFDLDFDAFITEEELFLTNRFKDFTTNRIFINGKAQSLQSITQKGSIISVKNSILDIFDTHINNFEREISNMNFNDNNDDDFDYFIEKNDIINDDNDE